MWVIWLLGCGGSEAPERIVSVPGDPVVELGGAEPEETVVWTDLGELFPEGRVGLPQELAELRPGISGARARDVLDAAHRPGIQILGQPLRGHLVLSTELARFPSVGVTLILDEQGAALEQVDLSLPHAAALVLLGERWGDPTETTFDEAGKALYRWSGDPWQVELHDAGDKAVVKFR